MNYLSNTTPLIKRNYFIIMLNILGIVFYFNFWEEVPLYSSGDSIGYVELSNQINNGFDANHYLKNTNLFRTLGYPFILSILNFHENPKLLFFIQLISHFFSATLVFFLLKRFYSSNLLTIVFFFYMILPIYVQHTAYILTESFSQLFLILGLLFFTKYIDGTKFQSFMFLSFIFSSAWTSLSILSSTSSIDISINKPLAKKPADISGSLSHSSLFTEISIREMPLS